MAPKAISLFSGPGLFDLGFKQAGFDIVASNEVDPIRNRTLHANFKHAVLPYSIHKLSADDLRLVPWAETNTCYIFMAGKELHSLRLGAEDAGLTWSDYLIWLKNNPVLGRKDYSAKHEFIYYGWHGKHKFYGEFSTTVLEYDKPQVSDLHPTMKPVELCARLISDGSRGGQDNDDGGVIYDAFGGSGPTLVACEQMGRTCRIMEQEPAYCDVIINRWEALTRQKAVLVEEGSCNNNEKGGRGKK